MTTNPLFRNVSNCNNAEFAGMFVRRFYISIMTDVLVVLTDRLHKSGLKEGREKKKREKKKKGGGGGGGRRANTIR